MDNKNYEYSPYENNQWNEKTKYKPKFTSSRVTPVLIGEQRKQREYEKFMEAVEGKKMTETFNINEVFSVGASRGGIGKSIDFNNIDSKVSAQKIRLKAKVLDEMFEYQKFTETVNKIR